MHEILLALVLSSPVELPHLTLRDSATHTLRTLPRVEMLALLAVDDFWGLLHDLGALGEDELDMAGVGPAKLAPALLFLLIVMCNSHVRVDTTVGTVRASPLLRRLVDLDVLHNQVLRVQALGIRIRLSVLEQTEQKLRRLHRPAGLAHAELLAYITPAKSICVFLQCILALDSLIPCDGHTYLGQYGQCSQHSAAWARLRRGS